MHVIEMLRAALECPEPDMTVVRETITEALSLSSSEIDAVLYQMLAELNRKLFPPITHLELVHTEGCNLACSYCFEKDILGYRKMSAEVARKAIDLLFDYSFDSADLQITHFGGEPLLNFENIRLSTEYAEQKAQRVNKTIKFDLTTNGLMLTDEVVAYLGDHNIMALVSVDGLASSHDRYRVDRGGKGTFDRVINRLSRLKAQQRWIGVKMTVMPLNVASLYEDVTGLLTYGVNHFLIGHATGVEWPKEARDQYGRELARLYEWYQKQDTSQVKIDGFDDGSMQEDPYFGCQAGRNSIAVTVKGEVSPCSKIMGFDSESLIGKLGDVWQGLTHLKNRSELVTCGKLQTACASKGIANDFRGGCFAVNYGDSGNLYEPSLTEHEFTILKRSACAGCGSH
jgi:uncharacterized protein